MTDPAFDAWHLPGVDIGTLETLEVGELTCRYPVPTPELLGACVKELRDAGRSLKERPVSELVDVVDLAAARLADPTDPLREQADRLVTAAAGYSPAMTRLVLDRMTADWRADRLRTLLDAALPDPAALDEFRPAAAGRRARAYGPDLAFHVFAGNVPGVAVTALVRALLAKAPVLGKLASGQPVLPILFARAVDAVDPDVGRALALTYWPGGSRDAEWRALEAADIVVVYGGEEAVASYQDRGPDGTRVLVHGPRFSVGLIARDAVADDPAAVARDVARAVAVFDQHGCVSPHAVWVEEGSGVSALDFAEALADALDAVENELPRARLGPAEASAIQQERAAAEMKGHRPDAAGTRVLAGPGTRWTVIYDAEPAFRPSCLNRLVRVHPIDALEEAVDLLAPAGRYLQSVAIAGPEARRDALAHRLAGVGATRITTFPRLPWPPPDWHHDGREPLRELLRWVDLES
ncbi:MAG: acyl-CoA reductase [Longimicrobiales bacterium]